MGALEEFMGLECGRWRYLVGVGEAGGVDLGQDVKGLWIMGEPFMNFEGSSTVLHFRKMS